MVIASYNGMIGIARGLTYEVTPEMLDDAYKAARKDASALNVPTDTPKTFGVNKSHVTTTALLDLIFSKGSWAKVWQHDNTLVPRTHMFSVAPMPELL